MPFLLDVPAEDLGLVLPPAVSEILASIGVAELLRILKRGSVRVRSGVLPAD